MHVTGFGSGLEHYNYTESKCPYVRTLIQCGGSADLCIYFGKWSGSSPQITGVTAQFSNITPGYIHKRTENTLTQKLVHNVHSSVIHESEK